jgi:DNA-directed RNA polymerase specialized sigma24 family protein
MEKIRNELEALYRERYAQFVAMAMTLVGGDVSEANNLAQEAFARAYANAESFRGEGALAGWVWRILFNHASRDHAERVASLQVFAVSAVRRTDSAPSAQG